VETAIPMATPIPTAANPAAVPAAAVTLPHWPIAAIAASGTMGQDQGDLAAREGIRLSLVTRTDRRSVETVGQAEHCTANLPVHGSPLGVDLDGPLALQ